MNNSIYSLSIRWERVSNVADINVSKRPKWVWIIALFYVVSCTFTIYSFYAVFGGVIHVTEAQQEYFSNLGFIDWAISIISLILTLTSAATLFMLKKITIKLWAATVIFAMVSLLYGAISSNFIEALATGGGIGGLVGIAIMVAIYFYSKRLDSRGYLS